MYISFILSAGIFREFQATLNLRIRFVFTPEVQRLPAVKSHRFARYPDWRSEFPWHGSG